MEQTYIYTTSEVSKRIEVSPSSIRKYAAALESHGHEFRNINNGRRFTEADIALLTRLRDLSAETKSPIDQLARLVVDKPAALQSVPQAHEERIATEVPSVEVIIAAITNEFTTLREENELMRKENAELKGMLAEVMREVKEVRQAVSEPPKPEVERAPEPTADLMRREKPSRKSKWRFWQ